MSEKTNCVFKKPVAYSKSKRMYCNFFFVCCDRDEIFTTVAV